MKVALLALALTLAISPAAARTPPPPPAPPPPRSLVLDAASPFIDATIAGKPVRLRVEVGAQRMVHINRSAARRLGFLAAERVLAGMLALREAGSWGVRVGRTTVRGEWSAEEVAFAGSPPAGRLQVGWDGRDHWSDADGAVSPAVLPYDTVRVVRRPAASADRITPFPVRWRDDAHLAGTAMVGGKPIDVQLEPEMPRTVATATAGTLLAAALGGALTGPPERALVTLGVERPVRLLALDRPFEVAGVATRIVPVRVTDWAGDNKPPRDADADPTPDEIAVTGRQQRLRAWAMVALGADLLAPCAEIAWEAAARQFVLTCPAPQGLTGPPSAGR